MKNKIKTHKASKKRFRVTGNGKVMRDKQRIRNSAHLKNKRKSTRKLIPENLGLSSSKESKKIKRLLNN